MAVETLPPEPAVGREDELVGRNHLEAAADPVRDRLREVALERAVADHTDRDLLREAVRKRLEERDLLEVVLGRLDRRAVLKGLGGITLGLPLLECMLDGKQAWAQAAPPRRYIVFFETPMISISVFVPGFPPNPKRRPMAAAMAMQSAVLPTPGGPQRIIECSRPDSKATRSGLPGPSRWRWPITSSSDFGRSLSASGAALSAKPSSSEV